jgi:hypothetical protein
MTLAGFPHSGISGSTPTCGSPKLIAAYRALLRLSVPRHPPCALISLDRIYSLAVVSSQASPVHQKLATHALVLSSRIPSSLVLLLPNPLPVFSIRQSGTFESAFDRRSTCERFLLVAEFTRGSRKEVIQPQVPLRLPCYDFAPVTELAFGRSVLLRGSVTDFGRSRLPWRDGRCVQGPGTYSPWCS